MNGASGYEEGGRFRDSGKFGLFFWNIPRTLSERSEKEETARSAVSDKPNRKKKTLKGFGRFRHFVPEASR